MAGLIQWLLDWLRSLFFKVGKQRACGYQISPYTFNMYDRLRWS